MKKEFFATHTTSAGQPISTISRCSLFAQIVGLTAAFTSPLALSQSDETSTGGFNFRAEPPHWYIGGNYGRTEESIDDGKIANSIIGGGLTGIEDDDSDRGYKLFAGYQFMTTSL